MSPIVAPELVLPGVPVVGEVVPMGPEAIREYAAKMARRYRRADRRGRGQLLDEFVVVTGRHRKHAIVMLSGSRKRGGRRRGRPSRFGPEVAAALVLLWRAMDYPWSVRLRAQLPLWLPSARQALEIDPATESLLLDMSARTMDRLLKPHRSALRRRIYGRTKPGTLLKHQVPIRSERWNVTEAGWCETDTVSHCGGSAEGEFAYSVNLSDVVSTWTETRAVLGKGQRAVLESLKEIRTTLPFALRGLDSDSGSEFINKHCWRWCEQEGLQFTRSRPYHKNDNAHIEQKNWTHVRKIFGWKRIDSELAVAAMNDLYANEVRLVMNYFQTSVKLLEKRRVGSRYKRVYGEPMTPLDRLITLRLIDDDTARRLLEHRATLDPLALVAAIERKVAAIFAIPVGPIVPSRFGKKLREKNSWKDQGDNRGYAHAPVRSFLAR